MFQSLVSFRAKWRSCLVSCAILSCAWITLSNSENITTASLGVASKQTVTEIPPDSRLAGAYERFVTAANGQAVVLVEGENELQSLELKTSRPVFKAFGLTANGRQLLYSPLNNGIPSGELYLEDLKSGNRTRIGAGVVMEAALSASEDKIAYTYAGEGSFGLAVTDLKSGGTTILVSRGVFADVLQWNQSGSGIHYFATSQDEEFAVAEQYSSEKPFEELVLWKRTEPSRAAAEPTFSLSSKFAPIDPSFSGERPAGVPAGFPRLERSGIAKLKSRHSGDAIANDISFRTMSQGNDYEVFGSTIAGEGFLTAKELSSGRLLEFGHGQLVRVLRTGIVLKVFAASGTRLVFTDWKGSSTTLGVTSVNFNLPAANSVMTQGAVGYPSPGNCSISAHSGTMEFAYDFQTQTVGAHALASASGLVVFNESAVTCNTVQTTCPDYSSGGCPGSFLGNVIIIQHADGTYSKYAHLQANSLQAVVGTTVDQGLYIGRQGHTGSTSGSFNGCGDHLHFQRQSSADLFGQSIAVDFADVAAEPLACGVNYVSASTEISHTISPVSQTFGITGGSGVVDVASTGGTWVAVSNNVWITITAAGTGTGNSSVAYTVADNSSGGARSGSMTIGGHLFTVTQAGSQPANQPPTVTAGIDQSVTLPAALSLTGTATDDGLPSPPAALTTTWSKVSGPGTVTFGNAGSLATSANFSMAGVYTLRLTATDSLVSVADDVSVIVNVVNGGGSLSATFATAPAAVDLSNEGTEDWAHWGLNTATSFNHRSGVASHISDYSVLGTNSVLRYTNNASTFSWSDGTPVTSASTNTGVYTYGVGNGVQLSVPADTTPRIMKLYLGVWSAGGRLEATMTDGSASPVIDTSILNTSSTSNAVYSINYRAASAGQTLVLKWTLDSSYNSIGNITLQGAAIVLDNPAPANQTPVANAGPDQSISLPASASLSGLASDDGLPNPPATLTSSWSKFSGPGTVAFGNANALNTTASFGTAGSYVLRLTVSDGALSSADDITITVNPAGTGGSLSVSSAATPSNTNLSTEGTADWAHWGLTTPSSFNHKGGIVSQISNYTRLGGGTVQRYANNPNFYSWTGGTPTASTTNTSTGAYIIGLNNGFQITAPADTTVKTLKVYVGLWAAGGRFEAGLSDGSSPVYIDTSLINSGATSNRVYTLNYQAASPGQTLTVKWTVSTTFNQWSNVTLQAATLF